MIGLRDSVLRQSFDGEPRGGWIRAEKISIEEAIKDYTSSAAYVAHREKDEGSITVGKLADFVVLSDDLTKIRPTHIHEVKVLTTVVGGKIVY